MNAVVCTWPTIRIYNIWINVDNVAPYFLAVDFIAWLISSVRKQLEKKIFEKNTRVQLNIQLSCSVLDFIESIYVRRAYSRKGFNDIRCNDDHHNRCRDNFIII